MNKTKLYWICQVFGWSLYGIVQISLYSITGEVELDYVLGQGLQVLLYIVLTHVFRFLLLKYGWLKIRWYLLMPRFFLSALGLAVFHYAFLVLYSFFLGDLVATDMDPFTILANALVSIFLFLFWSLLYMSFHYFERYNKSFQSEAALRAVELNNLKSQLNPHFIFNALNSIRALVDEDPAKCKQAITQLSNILRNSLIIERKQLIHFGEELNTVKDYLALESIRYEERLKTSFNIEEGSDAFYLPPLMVQTLVENGIKHGISNLKNGGIISLMTSVQNDGLLIQIRNSGQFLNGSQASFGYGLLNTRKRLELIYGEAARFHIQNEDKNTVLTEILIPKEL
jgi:two-component system LytT family sensor kinase